MKLTMLLSFLVIQASAAGFAQKITLTEKNSPLKKIFSEIRKQTGIGFLYTEAVLNESKRVSLSVKDASIQETLELIFKNQPITYTIENNTVILKLKNVSAQVIVVTGRVLDDKGQPLQSVSVNVKESGAGTTTDVQGNYRITAPENGSLIFSLVGYNTEEVRINNRASINVTLSLKDESLGEVVVVAYGTVKKGEATSAVASVNYEEFKNRPLQILPMRLKVLHLAFNL